MFWANNTTNEELKYSGNFILIKNQKIKFDTLLQYNDNFIFIDFIKEREEYLVRRLFDQINVMFDPLIFDQMNVYDIEFVYPSEIQKINSKTRM